MKKKALPIIALGLFSNSGFASTNCVINGKKTTLANLTSVPFTSKEDTLRTFRVAHDCLTQTKDRRLVFLDVYWYLTEGLFGLPEKQKFEDLKWYTNLLIGTADRYRRSLHAYEVGDWADVPDVWRLTFDRYHEKQSRPLDLLLGMNSHITYDIPLSLIDIQTNFDNPAQYNDFRSLNPYFTEITPHLWEIVASYEDKKDHSDFEMAWKGWIVNRWIIHHRLNAWDHAEQMSRMSMESIEFSDYVQDLDRDAYRRGRTFVFERPIIKLKASEN